MEIYNNSNNKERKYIIIITIKKVYQRSARKKEKINLGPDSRRKLTTIFILSFL